MDLLMEPFQYQFFRYGMAAGLMIGALSGLLGVFIVLRRMAYIGHGLSHAAIGGAAVSYVVKVNFYIGAGAWVFLTALLIIGMSRRFRLSADAVIGAVTTASFALGIAILSRLNAFTRNFEAALFGDILGVTATHLLAIALVGITVAALILARYKDFLFTSFDPEVAPVYGVPALWTETLLALVLAATILVSMQVIGVTLLAAAIVTPPLVARLLTNNFHVMIVLSTALGTVFGAVGLYASYFFDVASGATVVLTAALALLAAMAWVLVRRRARASAGLPQSDLPRQAGLLE